MQKYLLLILFFCQISHADESANPQPMPPVASQITNQTNTWYAGTEFEGAVNVLGLDWQCSGGTCILSGLYGQGLNMVVCQALSQKVGGLQYYYNESGMAWTKNKHSALLDQCNNPPK
jgi:hypothetical protein